MGSFTPIVGWGRPREKHKIHVSETRGRAPLESLFCNSLFCIFSCLFCLFRVCFPWPVGYLKLRGTGKKEVLKNGVGSHMPCLSSRFASWIGEFESSRSFHWAVQCPWFEPGALKLQRDLKLIQKMLNAWAFNVTELTLLAPRWNTRSCSSRKTNPCWSSHFHLQRTQHSVCKDVGRILGMPW